MAGRTFTNAEEVRDYLRSLSNSILVSHSTGVIPTSIYSLDSALGIGGLPKGCMVEYLGKWQSSKTTTALHSLASALKVGVGVYLNYEGAFDEDYAAHIGVSLDNPRFVYAEPETIEEGANIALKAIDTGQTAMVVIDSLAAASTAGELDKPMDKASVAERARMWSKFYRKARPALARTGAILLGVNHEVDQIDAASAVFGIKRTTTPGGNALKFFAAIRVAFRIIGSVKMKLHRPSDGEDYEAVYASRVLVNVLKNKKSPPFRQESFYVILGKGVSNTATLLDSAIAHGIISKNGSMFKFTADRFPVVYTARGLIDAIDFVDGHEDVKRKLTVLVFSASPSLMPVDLRRKLAERRAQTAESEAVSEPTEETEIAKTPEWAGDVLDGNTAQPLSVPSESQESPDDVLDGNVAQTPAILSEPKENPDDESSAF